MKAGGGARRNASLEQGAQVFKANPSAATTSRHRHTEKLSGDTYQPLYSPRPAKKEEKGNLPHKLIHDLELEIVRLPRARNLKLGENPYFE